MNTTTHPVAPEELMAFLDGELSAAQTQSVSVHLESCVACQELSASLQGVSIKLRKWETGPVPPILRNAAQVISNNQPKRSRVYRALGWTAAFATGFALLLAITVPNLLRSRMAANESSAAGSLRSINSAAATYAQTYGHYPPSLESLGPSPDGRPSESAAGLVDPAIAQGRKSGYQITYQSGSGGYSASAKPTEGAGRRDFSTNQDGTINTSSGPLDDSVPAPHDSAHRTIGALQLTPVPVPSQPMIARTVALSLVVKDFDASRKSLDAILVRHNGYAANLTVNTEQGAARSLTASLRIPVSQLAAAMNELKLLGHVETESQNGEEVTQQHADLVARLKNSRETEQRLQAILLQRTGKISDVLEVEQEIARVRGEIEQMEAEQKSLEHRVDFATIDLKFADEYKAKLGSPATSVSTQFHNALVNGYTNAADSLLGLLFFLVQYGPVLLLWIVILSSPAWLLWRRWKRASAVV